jgi:excisionase family DNA binding protein
MMEREEWFTVPEAARILGVGRQAIYDAVREGRLKAEGQGWSRRIHVSELLAYAIRTGKDPKAVIQRIQEEREVSGWEILGWILLGLGLAWLISESLKGKEK